MDGHIAEYMLQTNAGQKMLEAFVGLAAQRFSRVFDGLEGEQCLCVVPCSTESKYTCVCVYVYIYIYADVQVLCSCVSIRITYVCTVCM